MANSFNQLAGIGSHGSNASLVSHWLLDETSGTTAADRKATYNGTLARDASLLTATGAANWTGTSLLFASASSDVASLSSALLSSGTQFTIAGRFKATTWTNSARLISNGNLINVQLLTSGGNKLVGSFWDGSTVRQALSSGTYMTGTWIGFIYTVSPSNGGVLYVNGASVGTHVFGAGPAYAGAAGRPRTIGAVDPGAGFVNFFSGNVDEFAVFSNELSATEAAQWNAGPEPVWVGGGSHSLTIDGTNVTWSSASAAWGLPSPYSSGTNGSLTAETRVQRDGSTVFTGTGFSGTGTLDSGGAGSYSLQLRVSNTGGYDDGEGTSGWKEVATATVVSGVSYISRLSLGIGIGL